MLLIKSSGVPRDFKLVHIARFPILHEPPVVGRPGYEIAQRVDIARNDFADEQFPKQRIVFGDFQLDAPSARPFAPLKFDIGDRCLVIDGRMFRRRTCAEKHRAEEHKSERSDESEGHPV
jgi:hypothetical protein